MMPGRPGSEQSLAHFYRAVVGHMDVWRQRMDATTNWAAATTAVMLTFTFGSREVPHFVLLLAGAFQMMFLMMESRRYQIFDLWRRRFRTLNRYFVTPVLSVRDAPSEEDTEEHMHSLALDLGRTMPHLSLVDAAGYRIRRNYGYLLTLTGMAWVLKLEVHPTPAHSVEELISRAAIGGVAGEMVAGAVVIIAGAAVILALRAPSEWIVRWEGVPDPMTRILEGARRRLPWSKDRDAG
jgi:uncharacterized membrane protein